MCALVIVASAEVLGKDWLMRANVSTSTMCG